MRLRPLLAAFVVALAIGCSVAEPWSADESRAVEATLSEFRAAWLAGSREGVMSLVTDDVTLHTPGPAGTVTGRENVDRYWFPPSGDTAYPIARFEVTDLKVEGQGDFAVATGRSILDWSLVVRDSVRSTTLATTEFVSVFRRDAGRWRIRRQIFVPR